MGESKSTRFSKMMAEAGGSRRHFAWLTTAEIADMPKDRTVVVQAIGAVEQHGPQLPCITDSLVLEEVQERTVGRLAPSIEVLFLPILSYGVSTEHLGYPGTISLTPTTLVAVCRDVARSIAASGFRKLVFINGHGGHHFLLSQLLLEIRAETGLQVFLIAPYLFGLPDELAKPTSRTDLSFGHAAKIEISTVLAIAPKLVHLDGAQAGDSRLEEVMDRLQYLTLGGKFPMATLMRDISSNGVMGDPAGASSSIGDRVLDYQADTLAKALAEVASFEFWTATESVDRGEDKPRKRVRLRRASRGQAKA